MKSRDLARALITAGWLAGLTLIACGLPLPAAATAPVSAIGAAVALYRWGGTLRSALAGRARTTAAKLSRQPKTGGTVERA